MASIKQILPPQPHYISGYTGFVPGYKFHCGQSYSNLTHDLFMDRKDKRTLVLADLTNLESNGDNRLSEEEKAAIDQRCRTKVECKYVSDMTSGYDGHIPQYEFLCGNVFAMNAAKGIVTSEQMKRSCLCPECNEKYGNNADKQKTAEDLNKYTHPFIKVAGGTTTIKDTYKQHLPLPPSATPYFLDNENPFKKFMTGYTGHVPCLEFQHGLSYTPATNQSLKLFTTRYDRLKSNSFVPITATARPATKSVYQKLPYENGMIKNYAGHIPGDKFNVGKTTSEGSKDARNVLGQKPLFFNDDHNVNNN